MPIYAYLRLDVDDRDELNQYTNLLYQLGYTIDSQALIYEVVSINTPIFRRNIMTFVTETLKPGSVLIVKSLDCLGTNFIEMLRFIKLLESKKIILICLDYSTREIKGDLKLFFFHFIKIAANFEENSQNIRENNIKKPRLKKVGRPEILNAKQKKEVIEKYHIGYSISSLSKEYAVTRTVIQRLVNLANKNAVELH